MHSRNPNEPTIRQSIGSHLPEKIHRAGGSQAGAIKFLHVLSARGISHASANSHCNMSRTWLNLKSGVDRLRKLDQPKVPARQHWISSASLAQSLPRRSHNPNVTGSNPAGGIIEKKTSGPLCRGAASGKVRRLFEWGLGVTALLRVRAAACCTIVKVNLLFTVLRTVDNQTGSFPNLRFSST